MVFGTTGTGLDRIIAIIGSDEGLAARIPQAEIDAGAAAANRMNEIIVEGLKALGIGNDGVITASDVRDLSTWVRETHAAEFTELHGDDEAGTETGFHLVQNDGGAIRLFGRAAIDTVADGLYHLVFGYDRNNIVNEDGNANAQLDELAWWLNELLEDDLTDAALGTGPLANAAVDPWAVERSGTGLDRLLDAILDDPGLQDRIPTSEIRAGAQAAAELNQMILTIIKDEGLANDGRITASDVYRINAVIRADDDLFRRFVALHGDDEGGEETGFHLVQNDGGRTTLFASNAINTVADGLYHIGFATDQGRLLNEDGDKNASVQTVAGWLDSLLRADLDAGTLANPAVTVPPAGASGTGLDRIVQIIADDPALERRIDIADISGGIDAANTLNALLLDGIRATGAANDGVIQTADMRDVNAWLRADAVRYATFLAAHGDDEDGTETGFHLVQNDGAVSRLFGENAVNTVADGIYHFGFDISRGRFLNEDGAKNQSVEDVAAWVNELLSDADMAGLANAAVTTHVAGSSGTGLDRLVDIIMGDPGLNDDIATSEIVAGAQAADALNALIRDGLIAVGAAQDGAISAADITAVNGWIRADAARLARFTELHGDDEDGVETGFHLVQNDGADTVLFGRNAINSVADSIYHIGFEISKGHFLNEDGARNASVESVARWLNTLLAEDIESGALYNPAFDPDLIDVAALNAGLVRSLDRVEGNGATGHVELANGADLSLAAATITFNATPNTLDGTDALFSRDGLGFQDGGHVTIFRSGDDLKARVQTDRSEIWLTKSDVFGVGQPVNIALTLDGQVARLFVDGAVVDIEETTATWLAADEDITVGANAWSQRNGADNQVRDVFDGVITDVRIYDSALGATEIQAVTGVRPVVTPAEGLPDRGPMPAGTTGTGLDRLVAVITADVGLDASIPDADIAAGAAAADVMNGLIVEALHATGAANDGRITAGDVRMISDWIVANRQAAFIAAHGDDEAGTETGFHLVQNDGAKTRIFGDNAVDTVADGLYHLPFGYRGDRVINEDGASNQTLEDLAWWLEALLADELAQAAEGEGPLHNAAVDPRAVALTNTGLDRIVQIILDDGGIARNVSTTDAAAAAEAATGISQMMIDAIRSLGLADDDDLTASDVYAINDYIRSDAALYARFVALHGDDECGVETGYHLVQNDGGQTHIFGKNALDTVADGLFHIGFKIVKGRFQNEDGAANASVEQVADWLGQLLADDIAAGALDSGLAPVAGTTGTGLDSLVEIIMSDPGLQSRISELDIRTGAQAANAINAMIVEAIVATGVAKNGVIQRSDIYEINAYLREKLYADFVAAHGDDEGAEETGFHLVQNDGATSRLFSDNAVDTVADGLYHLGFDIRCGNLLNEDGNANASLSTVAGWLDSLLTAEDYARLAAAATVDPYVTGATGTGLDRLVDLITGDDGLINRISTSDIRGGAEAAQGMNEIILDAIRATGAANDGVISGLDVRLINQSIRGDAEVLARFTALHGDDEDGVETGFHLVQGDGARTELFDRNAVDTVADGLYHIGFEIISDRFVNEDGAKNTSVQTVAGWLNALLADDLGSGALVNPDLLPAAVDLAALDAHRVLHETGAFRVTKAGGAVEIADSADFDLAQGTVIVGFTASNPDGSDRDTIFSRDGHGYQDGGHLTMWVERGDVVARFQSTTGEVYLRADDVVEAGVAHDVAFTFDGEQAGLYFDGILMDVEAMAANWAHADENILLGGSLMYRRDGEDRVDDRFEGEIDELQVFDVALNFAEIGAATAPDYLLM